jgi:peptide/nickel transport system permease protein
LLLHLIPGDPAKSLLGPLATPSSVKALRDHLGLNKPLPEQYLLYLQNAAHGNLGTSTATSNQVSHDLATRAAPTLELLLISMALLLVLALAIGLLGIFKPKNWLTRFARFYSATAGSFPDFWIGLLLLFLFYHQLGIAPSPSGQLDPTILSPPQVTGSTLVDGLLAGQWAVVGNSIAHLVLPVATLVVVNLGPVLRMASGSFEVLASSRSIYFSRVLGLSYAVIAKRTLKQALPPILTLSGTLFVFLLSGVVVTEQVFAWGGLGQYVVGAVQQSDYFAVLGFLIIASIFTLVVYLLIDIVHALTDPRLQLGVKESDK